MIYSAGDCPVCETGEALFLKDVNSGRIFYACDSCGCAWNRPHAVYEVDALDQAEKFAPAGYSLATGDDIEVAGLKHLIVREDSEDDLRFNAEPGFHPPLRRAQDYDGRTIIIIVAKPSAQDEKEWTTLSGRARLENDILYLERGPGQKRFEIREEWLQSLKPVWANAPAPYCESELYLSLARNAFPNDAVLEELMGEAEKLPSK
jgi:hypothetical protein